MKLNRIYLGDCLEMMQYIPDKSIDMILTDLPYGTTKCSWDTVINLPLLWWHYKRIIKDNSAIILNATQPFTSVLIISNLKEFKYCWTWNKVTAKGHLVAKIRPMQQTEDICVFGNGKIHYYPIMTERSLSEIEIGREGKRSEIMGGVSSSYEKLYTQKYPKTVLTFKTERGLHPTQKPVSLFEYLIKTYTNEGDIVLDSCIGSGTTAIAALNTGRNFIGIEKERKYVHIARMRIHKHRMQMIRDRRLTI